MDLLHLADRALILDMGKIVFDGTAQEVLQTTRKKSDNNYRLVEELCAKIKYSLRIEC